MDTRCAALLAALALALALLLWGGAGIASAQEEVGARDVEEPKVGARAWVLTDLGSGEVLAGEDVSRRLSMGSTDKIMVGLVALDSVASGETSLDEEVTVSPEAASFANPIYSNVGLQVGEVLSVRELLMATLIPSGNDAAYALAEHLGGGGGDAGVERFVGEMNRKVEELGLKDTRFRNPTGLDDRGQYSSARDLAAMARAALEHPLFREMVGTDYAVVATQYREIELFTTNELLLSYGRATGVKTGTTPGAGPSLVASAAAGDESYVSVVLSDEDRFADSTRLLEHGFAAHDRTDLVVEGRRYAGANVPYRRGEKIELVAQRSVAGLVDASPEVEREVRVAKELPPAASPGTRLGEVVVRVDGRKVGESPLVAAKGYREASAWQRVWYTVEGIFA